MTTIFKSMSLGFLSLCFVWAICISICVSIRLCILHIKKDLQFDVPDTEASEQAEQTEKQATILSTPVESKGTSKRKRKKQQPAKVYFVMQEQEED